MFQCGASHTQKAPYEDHFLKGVAMKTNKEGYSLIELVVVLMFVAVMEYDFDNGVNKDLLAQKILGLQVYETNRKRFGR